MLYARSMTVFEKIITGEWEGSFVYRDEVCVAFMDLHPLNPGHVLIVPRLAVARLTELPADVATHLFGVAQRVLRAIELVVPCEAANVFLSDGEIAGQEVPHVHLHIVPRFGGDGLRVSFGRAALAPNRADLDRVAAQLATAFNAG